MIIHRELPSGPIARAYADLGNPFLIVAEAVAVAIVRALLVAITAKDRDTGLHSRRVVRRRVDCGNARPFAAAMRHAVSDGTHP